MKTKEIELVSVWFSDGGDGQTALYLDGIQKVCGDPYHDKIDEYIAGFIDGLEYTGAKFSKKMVICDNIIYLEGEEYPPTKYDDIKWGKNGILKEFV